MVERDKYPSELAERFQIRLPAGLRDRIKAYAERHGRSMNTEIVRILEREFPEPWSLVHRLEEVTELVRMLQEGVTDERVDRLGRGLQETLKGIASGRVSGLGEAEREYVREHLSRWEIDQAGEDESRRMDNMDEGEIQSMWKRGDSAKFE